MEDLQISIEELRHCAQVFRSINQNLNQSLNQVNKIMNELASSWSSPTQVVLNARFKKLLPIFDDYQKVVANYARFLDLSADSYDILERKMQDGVQ